MHFIFLLLPFLSFATELIQCPEESVRVNHLSPVTKLQTLTCGYMKDGSLVKHGPEVTLEASGKTIKTLYFNYGVEARRPVNVPGVEEASQKKR